ncbi:hypothetical protein FRB97_001023 [Tulasnella sp. 331]|nr:hypothetical protein FRB97_001023 [Tulasnella sp. 331]
MLMPDTGLQEPTSDGFDESTEQSAEAQQQKARRKRTKPKTVSGTASAGVNSRKKDAETSELPPLHISRNKHWRYISSFHGPWLQLPVEVLEALSRLNSNTMSAEELAETRRQYIPPKYLPPPHSSSRGHRTHSWQDKVETPTVPSRHSDIEASLWSMQSQSSDLGVNKGSVSSTRPPDEPLPPPIDPGVFSSVIGIRKLIDEAEDLVLRVTSGMSGAAMNSMSANLNAFTNGMSPSAKATAMALGLGVGPSGEVLSGGRTPAMSATRAHKLRVLAVHKVADAYRIDEIIASVMVMQGASALDDLAERVLKTEPRNADAKYVHFFHEKIPVRQLIQYSSLSVLDELILEYPRQLAYYRTRAILQAARDEFPAAIRDFTHALHEVRASRSARTPTADKADKGGKKGKRDPNHHNHKAGTNPKAADTQVTIFKHHPSTLPQAPQALEMQLVFLRGIAQLHHALFLIEDAVWKLERVHKVPATDGPDMRLSYIPDGKHGGIEIGNPTRGLLGPRNGSKFKAYRQTLNPAAFQDQVHTVLGKSLKDHERFISHFDSFEYEKPPVYSAQFPSATAYNDTETTDVRSKNMAQRIEAAYKVADAHRPGQDGGGPSPKGGDPTTGPFMTYHPFIAEAHFCQVMCHLLLGDMYMTLMSLEKAARVIDALDGTPVFANSRSLIHADFMEVLERLSKSWANGVKPHSLMTLVREEDCRALVTVGSIGNGSGDGDRIGTLHHNYLDTPPTHFASDLQSSPSSSGRATPMSVPPRRIMATTSMTEPALDGLDCFRILLNTVIERGKIRAEQKKEDDKRLNGKEKTRFSIALHGPKVDVALAWLAAVIIPDLERADDA